MVPIRSDVVKPLGVFTPIGPACGASKRKAGQIMSEGAEDRRQGWIGEAPLVLIYSTLILLLMLVWVRVPA
jgi:hypothetical protein